GTFQPCVSGRCTFSRESILAQVHEEQATNVRFVVDDEDAVGLRGSGLHAKGARESAARRSCPITRRLESDQPPGRSAARKVHPLTLDTKTNELSFVGMGLVSWRSWRFVS